MYQDLFKSVGGELSLRNLQRHTHNIYTIERGFSNRDFLRSTQYCARELRKCGAVEVEVVPLQADGKTTYLDEIMPQAWDIHEATLVITKPAGISERVLADYKRQPHCIAQYSAATPEEGIEAQVVMEDELARGRDLRDKIVLVKTVYPKAVKKEVVERGGLGIISGFQFFPKAPAQNTVWLNNWGMGPGWYPTKEEKAAFCFSLSPQKAGFLEELIRRGKEVRVWAKVKSKFRDGHMNLVTGKIPGRLDKEILLLAHIYEPQASDNATGGAALLEICRVITGLLRKKKIGRMKLSVRFLFTFELYGTAAYVSSPGKRGKILAAVNLDAFSLSQKNSGLPLDLIMNPASQPFFGDAFLRMLVEEKLLGIRPGYSWRTVRGTFSDDSFLADPKINIPVNWLHQGAGVYYHSCLNNLGIIDWVAARKMLEIVTAYVCFLASMDERRLQWLAGKMGEKLKETIAEEVKKDGAERIHFVSAWQVGRIRSLRKFGKALGIKRMEKLTKVVQALRRFVSDTVQKSQTYPQTDPRVKAGQGIIICRKTPGFPHCLARVPYNKRMRRPAGILECLAWSDGKRDLPEVLKLTELETEKKFTPKMVKDLLRYLTLLEKYGYVAIKHKRKLGNLRRKRWAFA